jgi:NTE family protein
VGWELGVLRGLQDDGVDMERFDRVIGTSAGAMAGATLAAGAPLEAIQPNAERDDALSDLVRRADFDVLGPVVAAIIAGGEPDQARRAELGAIALRSPHPEAAHVDVVHRFLPDGPWPDQLVVTAVDVHDGGFISWGARDGIGLAEAAAASSAVPGMFPPITIDGRRYMDGGMRSVTSADLAEGSEVVVIVAAPSRSELTDRQIADETAAIREAGGSIVEIRPDAASAEAFGEDPMDGSRQALVFEEGRRQGRAMADRVSAALDPAPTG